MRIAVVSDVHGNLTALEAVLDDMHQVSPDLVVHGGDLAMAGPNPCEVVDRVRELGWPCVLGNTDVALADRPDARSRIGGKVLEATERSAEILGPERVQWLANLPLEWKSENLGVVHATPGDCWGIVQHDADDATLHSTYGPLRTPIVVYGHIHHAYVRVVDGLTVVNSGSVSLSLDGDVRASYVVIDGDRVEHRRVAYDVERVASEYLAMAYPNAENYARWLRTGG